MSTTTRRCGRGAHLQDFGPAGVLGRTRHGTSSFSLQGQQACIISYDPVAAVPPQYNTRKVPTCRSLGP